MTLIETLSEWKAQADGLLPCPICNTGAYVLSVGERFRVYCTKLHCVIGPSKTTEAKAIAAWNTRTYLKLCEALKEAITELNRFNNRDKKVDSMEVNIGVLRAEHNCTLARIASILEKK